MMGKVEEDAFWHGSWFNT